MAVAAAAAAAAFRFEMLTSLAVVESSIATGYSPVKQAEQNPLSSPGWASRDVCNPS